MEKKMIEIDVKRLNEEKYDYLNELFNFPDYFGNNLDALFDCLTDRRELSVIYNDFLSANENSKKIIKVINKAVHELHEER